MHPLSYTMILNAQSHLLNIYLQVYDSGAPDRTNETTISVTVRRNSQCPQFIGQSQFVLSDVWYLTPVGSVLLTVQANDSDNVSYKT